MHRPVPLDEEGERILRRGVLPIHEPFQQLPVGQRAERPVVEQRPDVTEPADLSRLARPVPCTGLPTSTCTDPGNPSNILPEKSGGSCGETGGASFVARATARADRPGHGLEARATPDGPHEPKRKRLAHLGPPRSAAGRTGQSHQGRPFPARIDGGANEGGIANINSCPRLLPDIYGSSGTTVRGIDTDASHCVLTRRPSHPTRAYFDSWIPCRIFSLKELPSRNPYACRFIVLILLFGPLHRTTADHHVVVRQQTAPVRPPVS